MADIRGMVGHGTLMCSEKHHLVIAQMNSTGRIRTYLWFEAPEDWVLPQDPAVARKVLLEKYAGWDPRILKLIEYCDGQAMYHRPLYHLPVEHKWDHTPGVTLIGDATHLVSPFSGNGANVAMLDALELGLVLSGSISRCDTAEEREVAIAACEQELFVRGAKLAHTSKNNLDTFMHSDDPHARFREWRSRAGTAQGFQLNR